MAPIEVFFQLPLMETTNVDGFGRWHQLTNSSNCHCWRPVLSMVEDEQRPTLTTERVKSTERTPNTSRAGSSAYITSNLYIVGVVANTFKNGVGSQLTLFSVCTFLYLFFGHRFFSFWIQWTLYFFVFRQHMNFFHFSCFDNAFTKGASQARGNM